MDTIKVNDVAESCYKSWRGRKLQYDQRMVKDPNEMHSDMKRQIFMRQSIRKNIFFIQ